MTLHQLKHLSQLNKTNKILGRYSIGSTRIEFTHKNPMSFNIPYNLTQKEFFNKIYEIEKALTYYHEMTHYIQYWSTTNCIIEYFSLSHAIDQITYLTRDFEYDLPLNKYAEFIENKINNTGLDKCTKNEINAYNYLLGYKLLDHNIKWLQGTLHEDTLNYAYTSNWNNKLNGNFFITDLNDNFKLFSDGYGMTTKPYGLYKYSNILSGIGTLHLTECFAKSVEFEHLLHFNHELGSKVVMEWLYDDSLIYYNLPVRLFYSMREHEFKNEKVMKFFWAHFRLFIDIALMYSDYLFINKSTFKEGIINKYTIETKTQPGLVFYDVLKAFDKCEPLNDHEEDILRLYNDICEILNFPSLNTMLLKLISIIEERYRNISFKESFSSDYFKVALTLLNEKLNNPLLFLNKLIYSNEFTRFDELLDGKTSITTSTGIIDRKDASSFMFEAVEFFSYQLLNYFPISCPHEYILSLHPEVNIVPRKCIPENQSINECDSCYFKRVMNFNHLNRKQ